MSRLPIFLHADTGFLLSDILLNVFLAIAVDNLNDNEEEEKKLEERAAAKRERERRASLSSSTSNRSNQSSIHDSNEVSNHDRVRISDDPVQIQIIPPDGEATPEEEDVPEVRYTVLLLLNLI